MVVSMMASNNNRQRNKLLWPTTATLVMTATLIIIISTLVQFTVSQQSRPILHDSELVRNKFNTRSAVDVGQVLFGTDATGFRYTVRKCSTSPSSDQQQAKTTTAGGKKSTSSSLPAAVGENLMDDIDIIWQAEVGSSIYQTPTITYLDAKSPYKDIVIPTFVRFVEALHGPSGSERHENVDDDVSDDANTVGSIRRHRRSQSLQRSRLGSDQPSIWPFSHARFMSHGSALLYDIDGDHEQEVVVSTGNGELFFLKANGRLMRDRSFKLLPLRLEKHWYEGLDDHNMDISMNLGRKQPRQQKQQQQQQQPQPPVTQQPTPLVKQEQPKQEQKQEEQRPNVATDGDKKDGNTDGDDVDKEELPPMAPQQPKSKRARKQPNRKLLQQQEEEETQSKKKGEKKEATGTGATPVDTLLSTEAKEAMKLIHIPKSMRVIIDEMDKDDNPFIPMDYEMRLKEQRMRDEKEFGSLRSRKNFVYVDPHLLNSPVIVDLDGDGIDEIIFAVTYFFDEEYYASDPYHRSKLDPDVDIHKYVAGGIVVYELPTMKFKWELHLDLTTDRTKTKAHIYASPIVADIDSDGVLEIVVATSMGWIYVVDRKGKTKEGFPVLIGEIQGQPIVEDVNNDGDVEICAGDANSNIVCFNYKGEIVWETVTSGRLSSPLTAADLNGDGTLEIVATSTSGHIWALDGKTGKVLPGFPIKTDGPILSSASILTGMSADPQSATIIAPSHDGFIYFVDTKTTCIEKVDIGERIYSQILIDDVTGNGQLNLIVTTMNGNVFNLGTKVPYDPLKTLTGMTSNVAYRANYHGISVTTNSRRHRDEFGSTFKVEFDIVDNRQMPSHIPRRYIVRISIGGTHELMADKIYETPGRYVVTVPTPKQRFHGKVIVSMVNEHGVRFTDEYTLGFNIAFLNLFKWMIVLPFLLCAGLLLYLFGTDSTYPQKR